MLTYPAVSFEFMTFRENQWPRHVNRMKCPCYSVARLNGLQRREQIRKNICCFCETATMDCDCCRIAGDHGVKIYDAVTCVTRCAKLALAHDTSSERKSPPHWHFLNAAFDILYGDPSRDYYEFTVEETPRTNDDYNMLLVTKKLSALMYGSMRIRDLLLFVCKWYSENEQIWIVMRSEEDIISFLRDRGLPVR